MKSVKEVLEFFAKCLEEEKQLGFNMANWFTEIETDSPIEFFRAKTKPNFCGTSACIAGTVAANLAKDLKSYDVKHIGAWEICEIYVFGHDTKEFNKTPFHERDDILSNTKGEWDAKTVRQCLEWIFICPRVYGKDRLSGIEKDDAIARLKEWANLPDWDALYEVLDMIR